MFTIVATLGSILDFQLMLKIWQVPACKMEPRSGIIFCQKPAGRQTGRPATRPGQYLARRKDPTGLKFNLVSFGCLNDE